MQHDLPRARCWLEVDTAAVLHNLHTAESLLKPGVQLIAVLKADAYGLGLQRIGELLWENGVQHFAVACLEEAFALRATLPDAWILCMGETLDGAVEASVAQEIRLTAGSLESMDRISHASMQAKKTAYIHCKIDTGLHRIGFEAENAAEMIAQCARLPGIAIEGVYTHLALHNRETDIEQHTLMEKTLQSLRDQGIIPSMAHMLDSIGLTRYFDWQYQAVRVGAMLYGNTPTGFDPALLYPTVRFMARVARVAKVRTGACIGYDDSHPLRRDTVVATISVGYVDGFPRAMSNCGAVEIHGKLAPCLGLVCMDQMMVDVTEIPDVKAGDEATLLGGGISLVQYASIAHMNRNECTAIIGKRVPRLYL